MMYGPVAKFFRQLATMIIFVVLAFGCDKAASRFDRITIDVEPLDEEATATSPSASPVTTPTPTSQPQNTVDAAAPQVNVGNDISSNVNFSKTAVVTETNDYTLQWSKVSGPGTITFSDSTAATTSISASADGTYIIVLKATDKFNNVGQDQFTLIWDNAAPTAPTTLITTSVSSSGSDQRYAANAQLYFVWSGASDGAGSGISSYRVSWYADAACATTATDVSGLTGSFYTMTGTHGSSYSFKVTAVDRAGLSATSACSLGITVDTSEPPAPDGITAVTGTTIGVISVTVDFPAATADYNTVEVRRAQGTSAPTACSQGTLVKTYTTPTFPDPDTFDDDTGEAGQVFSYLVCAFDVAGNSSPANSMTSTATNIAAKSHLMFVTSTTYDGALGGNGAPGVTRADDVCTTRAAAGTVETQAETSWKAVISDSVMDAKAHIAIIGKVLSTDLTSVITTNRTGFWSGTLSNAVLKTESAAAGSANAWTGSTTTGARAADNCLDWNSGTSSDQANTGAYNVTNSTWLSVSAQTCDNLRALYCISQPVVPMLDGFFAVTGTGSGGRINITVDPPTNISKYDSIVVLRATGPTEPDSSCTSGTTILTIDPVTTATVNYTDTTATPGGGVFSYRVCALDQYGNILDTVAIANVTSSI